MESLCEFGPIGGPAVVVIVMLKTEPNQILESVIIRIVVQMRNLPLPYSVSVIQKHA